jgi:hypothetical protein
MQRQSLTYGYGNAVESGGGENGALGESGRDINPGLWQSRLVGLWFRFRGQECGRVGGGRAVAKWGGESWRWISSQDERRRMVDRAAARLASIGLEFIRDYLN